METNPQAQTHSAPPSHDAKSQRPQPPLLPDYWLPRPAFSPGPKAEDQLEALYQTSVALGQGGWIRRRPLPVWQILCWLTEQKGLLVHGTGDPNIREFEPRQSNDIAEFGNRQAVYAASDGLWAMFFAVVDRRRYRMTINNAAVRLELPGKEPSQSFYFFSLTDKVLAQQPWRDGVVYILPRQGFEEQRPWTMDRVRVHTNHWANLKPVKPLAKIRVKPSDFPFLHQIRGQDDDVLADRIEANPNGFPWVD
jgi:hypothetical protein